MCATNSSTPTLRLFGTDGTLLRRYRSPNASMFGGEFQRGFFRLRIVANHHFGCWGIESGSKYSDLRHRRYSSLSVSNAAQRTLNQQFRILGLPHQPFFFADLPHRRHMPFGFDFHRPPPQITCVCAVFRYSFGCVPYRCHTAESKRRARLLADPVE
jgi:hypothetical protein